MRASRPRRRHSARPASAARRYASHVCRSSSECRRGVPRRSSHQDTACTSAWARNALESRTVLLLASHPGVHGQRGWRAQTRTSGTARHRSFSGPKSDCQSERTKQVSGDKLPPSTTSASPHSGPSLCSAFFTWCGLAKRMSCLLCRRRSSLAFLGSDKTCAAEQKQRRCHSKQQQTTF